MEYHPPCIGGLFKAVRKTPGGFRSCNVIRREGGIWYEVGKWAESDIGPLFVYSNLVRAVVDVETYDPIFTCDIQGICYHNVGSIMTIGVLSKSRIREFWDSGGRHSLPRSKYMGRPDDTIFVRKVKLIREVTLEERREAWKRWHDSRRTWIK